ncbi:ribonuclease H-like domain-containing protein [Tanacetum coccineum]
MVPRAVLMKSGLVLINTPRQNISKTAVLVNTARQVNTTRQVNTAHSKTIVNDARPMSYLSKTTHLTLKRPIYKNKAFKNSNINQRDNTIRGKKINTARPKTVVNAVKGDNLNAVKASAYQRNMSYLTDYKEIDAGYVAFGGNPKGGKITRKGTIKTGNLDFENVYFVRELKFNLFNVAQMCDKKNSVLFNDTECIVLSPKFKLFDESQVLVRVPRKNNMYSIDLKNTIPKGGLTCLFAKATYDESKLWHRRLEPLDETSGIFKSFITRIENLVDHKVKVIIYDNGTEFKNRDMNQFYEMKGILRQFSVARTPQQYRVADRRNRILIEAARTMLADSKLPTTFWAEAVSTACYVQNRVLVVKPHNKTTYELFHGRTPTLSFMRPCGCPITILNNIDHLGKFEGKADEGTQSKDFAALNDVNVVGGKTSIKLLVDLNMPALKDYSIFDFSSDDQDNDAEADMNNLDTIIQVGLNPTTRIHKDHPLDQVIRYLKSATQTRKMSNNLEEHGYMIEFSDVSYHLQDLNICQPKLGGLWYPKDSPFDLVAYTDSDYAGASLDRKSTTGGKAKKSVRLMMEKLFGMELKLILATQS